MLALVGAPCQLAAADPALVLDECEVPGDRLTIEGVDHEILRVFIEDGEAFPPETVTLKLATAPPSQGAGAARIRRVGEDGAEILSKDLAGVTITAGLSPDSVTLDITGALDPALSDFMDIRSWSGDRVRMGDPNENGLAHSAASPWALVTPGDPARSFLYKRLITGDYGPLMPLIPRTWSAAATRAVWCWIRGMPSTATSASLSIHDAIDYDDKSCPIDPDAPNPEAQEGWPSVSALLGSRCAIAPCHSVATHIGGLDLSPNAETFTSGVVQAESKQRPGTRLVAPGQPAASYLLCKVDPDCDARLAGTSLMPPNGEPLDVTEIALLSAWILSGAPVE